MTIKNYLSGKRELILKAAHHHGVRRIRLFGSAARGELTAQSDFDFLVEFEPGRSLFDLIDLRQDLERSP